MRQASVGTDHLPSVDAGLTLLDRPDRRSTALHRLVAARLRDDAGPVYWVDARNNASTYVLADLVAPHHLERVQVARAFTAHQHHTLVRRLPDLVPVDASSSPTALVVLPCVTSLYHDDDLRRQEAQALLGSSLAILRETARACDVPVLVTAEDHPAGADPSVADHADAVVECVETDLGYRFEGPEFETQMYWHRGWWQTTIPYWVDLLGPVADAATPPLDRPARPATLEAY